MRKLGKPNRVGRERGRHHLDDSSEPLQIETMKLGEQKVMAVGQILTDWCVYRVRWHGREAGE